MEKVKIIYVVDPFSRHKNIVKYEEYKPLAPIIEYVPNDVDVVVALNGKVLGEGELLEPMPMGAELVVTPVVEGGHGGAKNVLKAVASIAVMVAAVAIPPALGYSLTTIAGIAMSSAIAIGGSMLVNAIFPAPKIDLPKLDVGGLSKETYGWEGVRSAVKQGTPIPVLYGKRKVGGNVISLSTYMDGQKQYLTMLLALTGHKVSSISDVEVNNQPIDNYKDVQFDTRLGTLTQAPIGFITESDTVNVSGEVLKCNSPVVVQTQGTAVEGLRINFLFPYGLFYANDKGGFDARSVEIKIEYAPIGGSWVEWKTVKYTDAQAKPLRFSEEITGLSAGQYQIRLTRLTKDNTNTRQEDEVKLESFSEVIFDKLAYPHTSLLGLKALATDQLSGSMPNVTCMVDRGAFDATNDFGVHTSLDGKASNNPAWAVADLLTNKVYGGNYNIDWDAFEEWATFCSNNNYNVNIYLDSMMNIWDAALQIARESRGILKIEGTRISVTIDDVGEPVQLFTVANIIEGSFKEHFLPLESRANCVEVTFFNEDHDYQREQFTVYLEDWNDEKEIKTDITLYGITNYQKAYEHARYMLNYNKYLTRAGEFDADIDAIACTVGDIVKLQYDVPNWGYGGRIVSADANGITIDQEITFEDGKSYKVVWRLQTDVQVEKEWTQSGTTTTNHIPLTLSDDEIPSQYDVYAVGEANFPYKLVRITGIDRKDDLTRHITWIEYNPSIYTDIPTPASLPDYNLDLLAKNLTVEQATYPKPTGDESGFHLSWSPNPNVLRWRIYYKIDSPEGFGQDEYGYTFYGEDYFDKWHLYKETSDTTIDVVFDNLYYTRYVFSVCGVGLTGVQNPDEGSSISIVPVTLNRKKPFFPDGAKVDGTFTDKIHLTWTPAITTALNHYEVSYSENGSQKTINTTTNSFTLSNPKQVSYTFTIVAVDRWGQSSESLTYTIDCPKPQFTSDAVVNGRFDCQIHLSWTPVVTNYLDHYEISYDSTTITSDNPFLIIDNPTQRSYSFTIIAVDKWGQSSNALTYSIENPKPTTPNMPVLEPFVHTISVSWQPVDEADVVGYNVYAGKENVDGSYEMEKVAFVQATDYKLKCDVGETWHVSVSAVDCLGEGSRSNEAVATSISLKLKDYNLDLPLMKDVSFSVSNGTLEWTSGTLNYKGNIYDIPLGSTMNKYIWWDSSSPNAFQSSNSRPAVGDGVWLIAYFDGNNVYPATQNKIQHAGILQASSVTADLIGSNKIITQSANIEDGVIETAHIQDGAITNAKISGVIESSHTQPDGHPAWQLDKSGSAEFHGITIYDENGNPMLTTDAVEWAKVSGTGRPEDNATVGAQANINLKDSSGNLAPDIIHPNKKLSSSNISSFVEENAIPSVYIANLDAGKITTGTLSADRIGAGSITADKLNVNQLSAITANLGDITAGTITMDTNGFIKGGQTSFNVGNGFYLGYDSSAYKFSVGNVNDQKYIAFDGANIEIGFNSQILGVDCYANNYTRTYFFSTDFQSLNGYTQSIGSGGSISLDKNGLNVKVSSSSTATTTIYREFPNITLFGDCHNVSWYRNIFIKYGNIGAIPNSSGHLSVLVGDPNGAYFGLKQYSELDYDTIYLYNYAILRYYDTNSSSWKVITQQLSTTKSDTSYYYEIRYYSGHVVGDDNARIEYYIGDTCFNMNSIGTLTSNVSTLVHIVNTPYRMFWVELAGDGSNNVSFITNTYKCLVWG